MKLSTAFLFVTGTIGTVLSIGLFDLYSSMFDAVFMTLLALAVLGCGILKQHRDQL